MRRTKAEAFETREGILDAAEIVFFEHGVNRATLEQVARAAGVTRGAIYWHFQNKVDLLNAVVERVRMPLECMLYDVVATRDSLDDLEALCTRALVQVHEDDRLRRLYAVLLLKCEYGEDLAGLAEREQATRANVTASLARFFERLQGAGRMTSDEEPRILAAGLHGYLLGLVSDYLRSPEQYRMPEDAARLVRLFFRAL